MRDEEFDFIKGLYNEGLVEKHLDEDAWADIRARRIERISKEKAIAYYGYLVGLDKAMRATKFVDIVDDGKTAPADYIKAYKPIVKMIDDIVNAGPAHINMLKQLHKRAKKRP